MKSHLLQVKDRSEWVYVTGNDINGRLMVTKSKDIAMNAQKFMPRYCSISIFKTKYPDKSFRYEP